MATVTRVLPWRRHSQPPAMEVQEIIEQFRKFHPRRSTDMITESYRLAAGAHGVSCDARVSRTSRTRWRWPASWPATGMDDVTIAAALLHDAVEDTGITLAGDRRALRSRGHRDRRRRHQARADPLRLQGGPAGGDHAQDAGRDGQGPAGAGHQARRPAPQHADHRRAAGVEAGAHRAGDARHLRAARPPPGHAGDQAAARGPVLRRRCTRSATPRSTTWSPARAPERDAYLDSGRRARSAAGWPTCTSAPRSPVARSTCGRSTRRWSSRARRSTRSSTWSASA